MNPWTDYDDDPNNPANREPVLPDPDADIPAWMDGPL